MPLLLDILRNADGPEYHKLRVKAMECAGLIGTFYVDLVERIYLTQHFKPLLLDETCSYRILQYSLSC